MSPVITNKYNLPEHVVKLLSKEHYDGSGADYSVTELIDSPRRVQLYRRHKDEIEEDVLDRYWSFLGNMAHQIMESATEHLPGHTTEQRFFCSVGNRVVSGKVDHYEGGTIRDYKYTSVWTVINQSQIRKWTDQLNCYAHLLKHNGFSVDKLEIMCILRDWQQNKVGERGYPTSPIICINVEMWSLDRAELFVEACVAMHEIDTAVSDECLSLCTSEEMWEKPSTWAVMNKTQKRALRVLPSKNDAIEFCLENEYLAYSHDAFDQEIECFKSNIKIVKRPGERTRCEKYCNLKGFCNQYKEYCNGKG